MHTLFRVLFLSCAAAQLFPLCTPSRAISQITCILLWKIHDIWRCSIMRKQWKALHMMPVPPVLAEQKRLESSNLLLNTCYVVFDADSSSHWSLVVEEYIQYERFYGASVHSVSDFCFIALGCFPSDQDKVFTATLAWKQHPSSLKAGGWVIHNPHPS